MAAGLRNPPRPVDSHKGASIWAGADLTKQSITIHYRRLEDATGAFGGRTLERAIRHAMGQTVDGTMVAEHWKRRAWLVPPSAEETLLMNLHHDGSDFFFGDLTQYTTGYMQALLDQVEDAPVLAVAQEPPPAGKEYVHSLMYWMAINNHLLLIQSRSLAGKQLEEYLTWLLKDRTPTIGPTGQVILQAKFDSHDVGGDLADISEIVVGGKTAIAHPVAVPQAPPIAGTEVEQYRTVREDRTWRDRAVEVLRAIMNNEADVQELLESVPFDADLQVSVHIGYRTKRRRVTRAPMQQALRNLPEGEITAIGKHGRMSGRDIRLSFPARVERQGNLLEPGDVIRAFIQAYDYFVQNGKIEP